MKNLFFNFKYLIIILLILILGIFILGDYNLKFSIIEGLDNPTDSLDKAQDTLDKTSEAMKSFLTNMFIGFKSSIKNGKITKNEQRPQTTDIDSLSGIGVENQNQNTCHESHDLVEQLNSDSKKIT